MATMSARYTVIDGEVVAQERGGVRHQLVPDPLGSTVALYDDSGTKTDTFSYWPYGEIAARIGTTLIPFQFVGTFGYYYNLSHQYYLRNRYYKASYNTFIVEDPIYYNWMQNNIYSYVDSNPITFVDIAGMQKQLPPKDRKDPRLGANCYEWACGVKKGLPGQGSKGFDEKRVVSDCSYTMKMVIGADKSATLPPCKPDQVRVRVYIREPSVGDTGDVHFMRQEPDGTWSDKHGGGGIGCCQLKAPDPHAQNPQDPYYYGKGVGGPPHSPYTKFCGEVCVQKARLPLYPLKDYMDALQKCGKPNRARVPRPGGGFEPPV